MLSTLEECISSSLRFPQLPDFFHHLPSPPCLYLLLVSLSVSSFSFSTFRHFAPVSEWVTIRNARYYHIRRRRVPLSEVYSSISAVFRTACTNETERLCVRVVPERSRVGVGGIGVLPDDITRKGGRVLSEWPQHRDSRCAVWR
jgi:hypothetical protein